MSNTNDKDLALPELSEVDEAYFTKQAVIDTATVEKEVTSAKVAAKMLSTIRRKRITVRHTSISLFSIQGLPTKEVFVSIITPDVSITLPEVVSSLVEADCLHQRLAELPSGFTTLHADFIDRYYALCTKGLFGKEFNEALALDIPLSKILPMLYPNRKPIDVKCYRGTLFFEGIKAYVSMIRETVRSAMVNHGWSIEYITRCAYPLSETELFEEEMMEKLAFDEYVEGEDFLSSL